MARKLRPDEFEARQRQLPATNKRNLGGRSLGKSREDLSRTPLGSPPVDYDVRSVYDVRPVAAFDFNIANSLQFDSLGTARIVEMTVPEGLICVLREIDLWFEPIPVGSVKSDFSWSLTLNGGDVPYNLLNPFGIAVDKEKVFLLADEFNRVGVRFTAATVGSLVSIFGFVRFHGTFQLKTTVPLPFEIANPTGRQISRPRGQPVTLPSPSPAAQRTSQENTPTAIPQEMQVVAPLPPATPAIPPGTVRPPFDIRLANMLVRGVPSKVPVKAKAGGFVPLTDQERAQYADYIATLR